MKDQLLEILQREIFNDDRNRNEIADAAGVGVDRITRIKTGGYVSLEILLKVARVYGYEAVLTKAIADM